MPPDPQEDPLWEERATWLLLSLGAGGWARARLGWLGGGRGPGLGGRRWVWTRRSPGDRGTARQVRVSSDSRWDRTGERSVLSIVITAGWKLPFLVSLWGCGQGGAGSRWKQGLCGVGRVHPPERGAAVRPQAIYWRQKVTRCTESESRRKPPRSVTKLMGCPLPAAPAEGFSDRREGQEGAALKWIDVK